MLILRNTDQVPCKIGDITLWVSPITWGEKSNLLRFHAVGGGETRIDETALLLETLRLSIRRVDGFEGTFSDGSKATLELDDKGLLTQEAIEILVRVIGIAPISKLSSAVISDALSDKIEGWDINLTLVDNSKKKD